MCFAMMLEMWPLLASLGIRSMKASAESGFYSNQPADECSRDEYSHGQIDSKMTGAAA